MYVFGWGGVGGEVSEWMIMSGFFKSYRNRDSVGRVSLFGFRWCYVCVSWESGFFLFIACPSIVYCARRLTAHVWCIQCSILLHLIDICFLPCILFNGRYHKSRLVCVWLSDLDLSRYQLLL